MNLIDAIIQAKRQKELAQSKCKHYAKFYHYIPDGGKIACVKCDKLFDMCLNPKLWNDFLKRNKLNPDLKFKL